MGIESYYSYPPHVSITNHITSLMNNTWTIIFNRKKNIWSCLRFEVAHDDWLLIQWGWHCVIDHFNKVISSCKAEMNLTVSCSTTNMLTFPIASNISESSLLIHQVTNDKILHTCKKFDFFVFCGKAWHFNICLLKFFMAWGRFYKIKSSNIQDSLT